MISNRPFLPALTILCLIVIRISGQESSPELAQAREAASLILNAAGEGHAPTPRRRSAGPVVRIFSDLLPEEPTDYDNVTVLFGDGRIDGDVKKDILVVWGDLEVNGRVERNTTAIFGSITVGSDAELLGDTRVFGGKLIKDPLAVVKSQPVEIGGNYDRWPVMSAGVDWFKSGAVIGRPIAPAVPLSWLVAAMFFCAYGLASVLFPRPVSACAEVMRVRPASSFLMGILLPILVVLVAALLTMTGVGVLVVPFLLIALVFATVVGKAAVLQYIGQRFGGALRRKGLQSPGAAFLTGGGILCLLYTVPVLGVLVWGVTMLFAMGGAMLATIESLQAEGSQLVAEPAPGLEVSDSTAMVHVGPTENADLRPAGFWLRFCSLLLDWFIVGTVAALVSAGVLFVPMIFTYYIGMWGWRGATVGDMVMNLKLVRDQGRPMDYAAGVVRSLASLFSIGAGGLGFVWCGISRDKKSWHDHIAGTNVMRVPEYPSRRK